MLGSEESRCCHGFCWLRSGTPFALLILESACTNAAPDVDTIPGVAFEIFAIAFDAISRLRSMATLLEGTELSAYLSPFHGLPKRTAALMLALLLFVSTSACDDPVTVLVHYGCDVEDLVVETWDGTLATEVARFAPGTAPVCFSVGRPKIAMLTSRCVSGGDHVPVQMGVFDPVVECNR